MVVKRFTNKKGKHVKKTKKIMRGGSVDKPVMNNTSYKLGQLSVKAKNTFKNKLKRVARKTFAGIVTTGLMPVAVGIGAVDHGVRYVSGKFRKQPSITESTTNSETNKPMTFTKDAKDATFALYRTLAGTGLSKSTKKLITELHNNGININKIAEQIPANRLQQALNYYEAQKGNPFAKTGESEKLHEIYRKLVDSKQNQEK